MQWGPVAFAHCWAITAELTNQAWYAAVYEIVGCAVRHAAGQMACKCELMYPPQDGKQ